MVPQEDPLVFASVHQEDPRVSLDPSSYLPFDYSTALDQEVH